jgi:hypothetical protein
MSFHDWMRGGDIECVFLFDVQILKLNSREKTNAPIELFRSNVSANVCVAVAASADARIGASHSRHARTRGLYESV